MREKPFSGLVAMVLLAAGAPAAAAERGANTLPLAEGWALQSSAKVKEPGEVVVHPGVQGRRLVPDHRAQHGGGGAGRSNKVYPDPYFGMNIRNYPGMTYPIGKNFSKYPMAADSPFAVPWWYRKQFTLPAGLEGQERLAALRGHQLPGQHLAERQADRQARGRRRRPAHLRARTSPAP